jgi:hypothetical protein
MTGKLHLSFSEEAGVSLLSEHQARWLAATPEHYHEDARAIVTRAGVGKGAAFGAFAKGRTDLFERLFAYPPPRFLYRLTQRGRNMVRGIGRKQ